MHNYCLVTLFIHVCKGTVVHRDVSVFGEGSGPIFLDNLACSGDEQSLLECNAFTEAQGLHNCRHYQDVGITCVGEALLFSNAYTHAHMHMHTQLHTHTHYTVMVCRYQRVPR